MFDDEELTEEEIDRRLRTHDKYESFIYGFILGMICMGVLIAIF